MGLLLLEGSWNDVYEVATKSGCILKSSTGGRLTPAWLKQHTRCRLIRRMPDGSYRVLGTAGNGLTDDASKGGFRGVHPNVGDSENGRDVGPVVLQVPTGEIPQSKFSTNKDFREALLSRGVETFDISVVYKLLSDQGHQLLGDPKFSDVQASITLIKEDRNRLMAHKGEVTDGEYRAACANIRKFLRACVSSGVFPEEWGDALEQALQAVSSATWYVKRSPVCRTTADRITIDSKQARELTPAQGALLKHICSKLGSIPNCAGRFLIEAPGGSGKTLLCVKLALHLVIDAQNSRDNTFFGSEDVSGAVLVICHSTAMVHELTDAFEAELVQPVQRVALTPLSVDTGFAIFSERIPNIQVHIMMIDALVDATQNVPLGVERGGGVSTPWDGGYSAAVVDEGHLTFSYQPHDWLDGQHRFPDSTNVRELLDRVLRNGANSAVVIFHDTSHQLTGLHQKSPQYPMGCERAQVPLPVVRNPGPVRDAAVPFSAQLRDADIEEHNAVVNFFPLSEEAEGQSGRPGHGIARPVRLIDIPAMGLFNTNAFEQAQRFVRSGHSKSLHSTRDCHQPTQFEYACEATSDRYAEAIVKELDRIRQDIGTADWPSRTAVLVPGCPKELANDLFRACRVAATLVNLVEIVQVLTPAPVVAQTRQLYFGAVENFAGCERPFVVMAGMQHPKYTTYRIQKEGWISSDDRVDARAYIGMTRCTLELTVIESWCGAFAAHYSIAPAIADGSGLASLIGVANIQNSRRSIHASVTLGVGLGIWKLHRLINVDISSPPPLDVLANAAAISITIEQKANLTDIPFDWRQCHRARDVHLVGAFGDDCKSGTVLDVSGVLRLQRLEVLNLVGNGFQSLPDAVGAVQSLTILNLAKNHLHELPESIGGLVNLLDLIVGDNDLERLPESLGNLRQLRHLDVRGNHLIALPDSICRLGSLASLFSSNNTITRLPDGISDLVTLCWLDMSRNKLAELPFHIGKMGSLQRLNVSNNELTVLPESVGSLYKLNILDVSNNQLSALPDSLGCLSALRDLKLYFNNNLAVLPKDLAQLHAMRSLQLGTSLTIDLHNGAVLQRLHKQPRLTITPWSDRPNPPIVLHNKKCIMPCDGVGCETRGSTSTPLQVCANCRHVFYCSKQCQRSSWRHEHSQMCANLRWNQLRVPGIRVCVQNLIGRPELNGLDGVVEASNETDFSSAPMPDDRVVVFLDDRYELSAMFTGTEIKKQRIRLKHLHFADTPRPLHGPKPESELSPFQQEFMRNINSRSERKHFWTTAS